jgi:ubiquinone/menaquinone biosynthesis C-methylase UbiE
MAKRSYFNPVSGDRRPMGRIDQGLWLASNLLLGCLPSRRLAGVEYFHPPAALLDPSNEQSSWSTETPSRILCNLFWRALPVDAIRQALGSVRVLDCGCGDGSYSVRLDQVFGGLDGYTGFDSRPRERWSAICQEHPGWRFVNARAEDMDQAFDEAANLIISQSAIEHFPYDLTFFEMLAERVQRPDKKTLQIHLLPPQSMWRHWGFHGYRGYNEHNLARLMRPFRGGSRTRIVLLGGPRSDHVHRTAVRDFARHLLQRPVRDVRKEDAAAYAASVAAAIRRDSEASGNVTVRSASFVALVIETGLGRSIPLAGPPGTSLR